MAKSLCKLKLDHMVKEGKQAKYQCKKCDRLASKKKYLCKPKSLK